MKKLLVSIGLLAVFTIPLPPIQKPPLHRNCFMPQNPYLWFMAFEKDSCTYQQYYSTTK